MNNPIVSAGPSFHQIHVCGPNKDKKLNNNDSMKENFNTLINLNRKKEVRIASNPVYRDQYLIFSPSSFVISTLFTK
jgi:hypothetical protein